MHAFFDVLTSGVVLLSCQFSLLYICPAEMFLWGLLLHTNVAGRVAVNINCIFRVNCCLFCQLASENVINVGLLIRWHFPVRVRLALCAKIMCASSNELELIIVRVVAIVFWWYVCVLTMLSLQSRPWVHFSWPGPSDSQPDPQIPAKCWPDRPCYVDGSRIWWKTGLLSTC